MFFSIITNNDYKLYFATENWLNGSWYDSWNLPAPGTIRSYYSSVTNERFNWTPIYETDPAVLLQDYQNYPSRYEHLDPKGCMDAYANTYLSDRRNVVLLSPWVPPMYALPSAYAEEIERVQKNSSLHWVMFSSNEQEKYNKLDRYGWMCNNWNRGTPACTNQRAKEYAAQNIWTIFGLAGIRLFQSEASGQLQRQLSFRHRDCCHTRQPWEDNLHRGCLLLPHQLTSADYGRYRGVILAHPRSDNIGMLLADP